MRSTTALAYTQAAAGASHALATRVDILYGGLTVATGLAAISGTVTYDRTAAHLARLTLGISDPTRLPRTSDDILTPFGYEAKVWRGIDGDLLPLGVFPIQTSIVDGDTLLTSVTAVDRSIAVADARFEDDYAIAAGTNYATAIQDLIAAGVPGLTYNFPTTTRTTPALTFGTQGDRWKAAQQMAESLGWEIYFDGDGECAARLEPDWIGEPVATIAEGANLTGISLALDRTTAYNKVIAMSRNAGTGAQYRGEASDDNPASPSYYGGPFGKKPRFYFSEFLNSDDQCTDAAAAILRSNLGVAKNVNLDAVPDPRLETSDVVLVQRTLLGIDELHIIDKMTIGLEPNSRMTIGTRAQIAS